MLLRAILWLYGVFWVIYAAGADWANAALPL